MFHLHLEAVALNPQSKELSIQVKQTIVSLQKQNKSIREIAGTLGQINSLVDSERKKMNALVSSAT